MQIKELRWAKRKLMHFEFKLQVLRRGVYWWRQVFHLSETSSFILQNDKNEIFGHLKQWAQEVSIFFTQIDEDPSSLRHQIALQWPILRAASKGTWRC